MLAVIQTKGLSGLLYAPSRWNLDQLINVAIVDCFIVARLALLLDLNVEWFGGKKEKKERFGHGPEENVVRVVWLLSVRCACVHGGIVAIETSSVDMVYRGNASSISNTAIVPRRLSSGGLGFPGP